MITQGCTEVGRVLDRLVATGRPAALALERLDFRNPALSRRLNAILRNCGRSVIEAKLRGHGGAARHHFGGGEPGLHVADLSGLRLRGQEEPPLAERLRVPVVRPWVVSHREEPAPPYRLERRPELPPYGARLDRGMWRRRITRAVDQLKMPHEPLELLDQLARLSAV